MRPFFIEIILALYYALIYNIDIEREYIMATKERTSLSLSKDILEKIKELAVIENRTVSNIVETALIQYIKNK